jgi:hypothetical protein
MDGFHNTSIEKLALDVTSSEDVDRVIKTIVDAEGRIDIVVNNAGIMGISKFILPNNPYGLTIIRRRPSDRSVSRTGQERLRHEYICRFARRKSRHPFHGKTAQRAYYQHRIHRRRDVGGFKYDFTVRI